jgi:hypothetical protein
VAKEAGLDVRAAGLVIIQVADAPASTIEAVALDLASEVPRLLAASALVSSVELRGSRAEGTATRYSDWDFVVFAPTFETLAMRLPDLVSPLEPLVQLWDPLSNVACYMLIMDGPTKIDLIFEEVPNEPRAPWTASAETLPAINDHFWDWTLWLTSKAAVGKHSMVSDELAKMSHHLLAPLGIAHVPGSLGEAVDVYLGALADCELRFDVAVDRRAEGQIVPVVTSLHSTEARAPNARGITSSPME